MTLSERMKRYETLNNNRVIPKTPVIIRLDGKAFHTFTKGMDKPFDSKMDYAMQATMVQLCKNIQGCVLGYTQSDEITLVLSDMQNNCSEMWFGGKLQKMCSVSASMATLYFNEAFMSQDTDYKYRNKYMTAMFDSRVFNVPEFEVINVLRWRQQDAVRNSILALGLSIFSQKEIFGKKMDELKLMCKDQGTDWDDLYFRNQRGISYTIEEELSDINYLQETAPQFVLNQLSK